MQYLVNMVLCSYAEVETEMNSGSKVIQMYTL